MRPPYICTVFLHRDIVSFTASANDTKWHCPEDMQWETDHSWAIFTTLLVEKIFSNKILNWSFFVMTLFIEFSVACACRFSWFRFHLHQFASKFPGTLLIKFQRWLELKT